MSPACPAGSPFSMAGLWQPQQAPEDGAGHGAGEQAGSKRRYNADTASSVGGVG